MLKKIIKSMTSGLILKISLIIWLIIYSIALYRDCYSGQNDLIILSFILFIIYILIVYILKMFSPYYRNIKKMNKLKLVYDQINYYIENILPEEKKYYPKTIYKFVSLTDCLKKDNEYAKKFFEGENEKKLTSLENNQIWFSNISSLNDPLEGNMYEYSNICQFDVGLFDKKTEREILRKRSSDFFDLCESIRKFYYISSFTKTFNSLPMWAHYSSNSEGYCIEFEVIDATKLYKVIYSNGKIDYGFDVERLLKELTVGEIEEDQFRDIINKMILYLYTVKSAQWDYEEEIRIIHRDDFEYKSGCNIPCEELGLKIKKVLIGINCSERNEIKLRCICEKLNIKVEKMVFDYKSQRIKVF